MPPRKSSARKASPKRKATPMKMTRFGATGKNVLISKRQNDARARGDRRRIYEDESVPTRLSGKPNKAGKKGPAPVALNRRKGQRGVEMSMASRRVKTTGSEKVGTRLAGEAKKPKVASKGPSATALARNKGQQGARMRAAAAQKKGIKQGGVNLPKFASEVSRNFKRGAAAVGKSVDEISRGVGAALPKVTPGNQIQNAVRTGTDAGNPLKRQLRK